MSELGKVWGRLISLFPEQDSFDLSKPAMLLGRHRDCEVRFSSMEISSYHTKIFCVTSYHKNAPGCYIQDLSRNGTYLNGKLIGRKEVKKLQDGDEISLIADFSILDHAEGTRIGFYFQDFSTVYMMSPSVKKFKNIPEMVSLTKINRTIETPENFYVRLEVYPVPYTLEDLKYNIKLKDSVWTQKFIEIGGLHLLFQIVSQKRQKTKRNSLDRLIEILCIGVIKKIMEKQGGITAIRKKRDYIKELVLMLYSDNLEAKKKIMKLLAVFILYSEKAYLLVLNGFTQAKEIGYERFRFHSFVKTLKKEKDLVYKENFLLLMNCLISRPNLVTNRMIIRDELDQAGLSVIMEHELMELGVPKIDLQISNYLNQKQIDEEQMKLRGEEYISPLILLTRLNNELRDSPQYGTFQSISHKLSMLAKHSADVLMWRFLDLIMSYLIETPDDFINLQIFNQLPSITQRMQFESSLIKIVDPIVEDQHKKIEILKQIEEKENMMKNSELSTEEKMVIQKEIEKLYEELKKLARKGFDEDDFSDISSRNRLLKLKESFFGTELQDGVDEPDTPRDLVRGFSNQAKGFRSQFSKDNNDNNNSNNSNEMDGNEDSLEKKENDSRDLELINLDSLMKSPLSNENSQPKIGVFPPQFGVFPPPTGGAGPPPPMGGPPPPMGGPPPPMGGPPPPMGGPPPPMGGPGLYQEVKVFELPEPNVKMKQFYWNKIPFRNYESTIWKVIVSDLQKSDFVPDFQFIENHFCVQKIEKEDKKSNKEESKKKVTMIDAKRTEIVSTVLKNWKMTPEMLFQAIVNFDQNVFDFEKLTTFQVILPREEESRTLLGYKGEPEKLEFADKFMYDSLRIDKLPQRIEVFSIQLHTDEKIGEILTYIKNIHSASSILIESPLLKKILSYILLIGNFANSATKRSNAVGFKIDFLTKIGQTRSVVDNSLSFINYIANLVYKNNPDLIDVSYEIQKTFSGTYVAIETIQKDITEIRASLKTVETHAPLFKDEQLVFNKINTFLKTSNEKFVSLEKNAKVMKNSFDTVVKFFGEDPAKMVSTDFFLIFHDFLVAFQKAAKDNEKKRVDLEKAKEKKEKRKQREKQKKAKSPQESKSPQEIPKEDDVTVKNLFKYLKEGSISKTQLSQEDLVQKKISRFQKEIPKKKK